jgi:hypothetical protein
MHSKQKQCPFMHCFGSLRTFEQMGQMNESDGLTTNIDKLYPPQKTFFMQADISELKILLNN